MYSPRAHHVHLSGMENVLLCNTQWYLSLSSGQLNFCEFKRDSYAVWWVMVLQIKTFHLITGFTSHFSHNLILLWLCGFSLLLGLFFTCKTYRRPFWVKGSHPTYIASYQVLLRLQQGMCSGKRSICSFYSPRSERKSWNTSKYFLRKADQCPQSMALRPITVTSAFLTMLGISSACLARHIYSWCSEILLLAASPDLTVGAWHKIGIFYITLRKMWNTGEMSDQNAYGRVKCESTLCPYWK